MIVTRLNPSDLDEIEIAQGIEPWSAHGSAELADRLSIADSCAARIDGRLVAVGGVVRVSRDVGLAWSMISRHAGPHMFALTRAAQRVFEIAGIRRLIASSEASFPAGCRWLEVLGFTPLERVTGFGADGRDHQFFAKVM